MKKSKIIVLLVIAFLFTLAPIQVFAEKKDSYILNDCHTCGEGLICVDICPSSQSQIAPRIGCTVCQMGLCYSICLNDLTLNDIGTHSYDWWTQECEVRYYTATGAYQCDLCGSIRPVDYTEEFGDQHLCKEIHDSCGKGTYDVCVMGGYV